MQPPAVQPRRQRWEGMDEYQWRRAVEEDLDQRDRENAQRDRSLANIQRLFIGFILTLSGTSITFAIQFVLGK